MNLKVLTSSDPGEHEAAIGASGSGVDGWTYLIHDAVELWQRAGWEMRADSRCRVYLCAYNLEKRGMELPGPDSPVIACGLSMLGRLLEAEDDTAPVKISHGNRREAVEEAERIFQGLSAIVDLTIELIQAPEYSKFHLGGRRIHIN